MFAWIVLAVAAVALIGGCRSTYFTPADAPSEAPQRQQLAAWPDREYWSGIVFNGRKIGFSHVALAPAAIAGMFELRYDAVFALRFLGFDKRLNVKSWDLVREDLDLVAFRYEYVIDGNALAVDGQRRGDALEFTTRRGGEATVASIAVAGRLYPQAAIGLYPTLAGFAPGREFRFPVWSGELQKVVEVTQRVAAYERSALFDGEAFRVETTMEGYRVETWISPRGAPRREIAMNGILISGLEDEARARNYLASASLDKSEALLEFALVRPERPIERPHAVTLLTIALGGAAAAVPSDERQQCTREGAETLCALHSSPPASASLSTASDSRDLASTLQVPARDPRIVALAREIAAGATDPRAQVDRIVAWIDANIRKSPVDAWTALDALDARAAECQGHAFLYAALARALGIPTRVVNGIAYFEEFGGFLYHAWGESLVAGRWLAVDPTLATVPADATHLKLVEGESPAALAPLVDWVGRLELRVIDVGYGK
jgi:transglutaminase-like putative cysteine protease